MDGNGLFRFSLTVFPRINAAAFVKFFMIWVRRLFEGGVYSRKYGTSIQSPLNRELPLKELLSSLIPTFEQVLFQGALPKKPYNPILGETFYCSWKVLFRASPHKHTTNSHVDHATTTTEDGKVTFVAEQVTHHPPSE